LEFVGRVDGQVKVRGFRVEVGEVESVLSGFAGVRGAAVAADGDRLVGAVVGEVDVAALREHVARTLPEYMVPALVLVDALPLTPSGKVDRAALPALGGRPVVGSAFVGPRDRVERLIAGVWGEVLGVDRVGVHDNFFELGGHSLAAVAIQSTLDGRLPRPVSLIDLFRYPTVAALAEAVGTPPAPATAGPGRGAARRAALTRIPGRTPRSTP